MNETKLIYRDTLMDHANKVIRQKQHIYLSAPGGYGKSIAARQIAGQYHYVWSSCYERDNDPGIFYEKIFRLLGRIQLSKPLMCAAVPHSFAELSAAAHVLPVHKKNRRTIILLDDLHHIHNTELLLQLPVLAAKLPPYITVLVVSRNPMEDHWITFTQLKKELLLFSAEEISELSKLYNRPGDTAFSQSLLAQTGGWALGLCTLLAMDQHGMDFPHSFTVYMDQQIWGKLSWRYQTLFYQCAIPEELSISCFHYITGEHEDSLAELYEQNLFITRISQNIYQLHDVFREYLICKIDSELPEKIRIDLYKKTACWYYLQQDYYTAAAHYAKISDLSQVAACIRSATAFYLHASVKQCLLFYHQALLPLSEKEIISNPFLLEKYTWMLFLDGSRDKYLTYIDKLYRVIPEFSMQFPDLLETAGFIGGGNFMIPFKKFVIKLEALMQGKQLAENKPAITTSITQNLFPFHRSMRDYSEYYHWTKEELLQMDKTIGRLIRFDYPVMQRCLLAGILYERNDPLGALKYVLDAYEWLTPDHHAESTACTLYLLFLILKAIKAEQQARKIFSELETYMEQPKASCLTDNFQAVKTKHEIEPGNGNAAKLWLRQYCPPEGALPFYQIQCHHTALRCYMILERYNDAASFGSRLLNLAINYERPLDIIEVNLLLSIAYDKIGNQKLSFNKMRHALETAQPYKFYRLFLDEGKAIIPILGAMLLPSDVPAQIKDFKHEIYRLLLQEYHPGLPENISLPHRQLEVLRLLAEGYSYQNICIHTGLKKSTVKTHINHLFKNLHAATAEEAIKTGILTGLLKP